VTAAASRHVSKKSCLSAKQPLLPKRKVFSDIRKNRPGLRPGRFFYGRSKRASVSVHSFRLAMKKGLAGEGKTLEGLLKSWVEPRKKIKRV
jgi:hypothetical protein